MTAAALVEAYRALGQAGLIAGSSGNVSVRVAGGMLISPSGTSAERIVAADVIAAGLEESAPGASSEWALHAAVYRARPEFGAIVHTHADCCTALACLGEALPAFHYEVLTFGGDDVRCAPYVTFGTPALADFAVAAMEGRSACLLGNHGMIAAGVSVEAACAKAFALERLCRQYLLARGAGHPRLLTAAEILAARERFRTYQLEAR